MKYNLDILPIKLLFKIIDTGDTELLEVDNHIEVWEKLYLEFKELDPTGQGTKLLDLTVQINVLELKKKIVIFAVQGLKFGEDKDLLNILSYLGYELDENDYFNELTRIEKVVKNLDVKIAKYKSKLPKGEKKANIDEVIISYCSILGVSYDTNKVSVNQFYAMQNMVKEKINNAK